MTSAPLLALLAIAAIWPFGHRDRDKVERLEKGAEGTIKSLERGVVEIDTSATIDGGEAMAIESYRLFLDLASDDALLRAEAMRRLADLQLETADAVELQGNVQALGANVGGTIGLYEQLLEAYPDYKKNDLVL